MLVLAKDGVEILKNFVDMEILNEIRDEVISLKTKQPKYGIRQADKKFVTISKLIHCKKLLHKATDILGSKPQVVRVIYFDKTPENNWLVPWHQDRTIAVNKKIDVVGGSVRDHFLGLECKDYDFSLPTKETKIGVGHRGFDIYVDTRLSYEDASERRDFTINVLSRIETKEEAIAYIEQKLNNV